MKLKIIMIINIIFMIFGLILIMCDGLNLNKLSLFIISSIGFILSIISFILCIKDMLKNKTNISQVIIFIIIFVNLSIYLLFGTITSPFFHLYQDDLGTHLTINDMPEESSILND